MSNNLIKPNAIKWILIFILIINLAITIKMAYLIFFYEPQGRYGVKDREQVIEPVRGDILARDGRPLAISSPKYDIHFDCTVCVDSVFTNEVGQLAKELSSLYGNKSQSQYKSQLVEGRKKGSRYLKIGNRLISHEEMLALKEFPIFRRGQNRGGIIIEKKDSRIYPYGTLARRTIGYVKNNDLAEGKTHIGIEGRYNSELHGKEGMRYQRRTENNDWIPAYDREIVLPEDGKDIYTTLDINIQDIADKALRSKIDTVKDVIGGCVIVMEVETGAIRAMVNLHRGKNGKMDETHNYAISQTAEPGSVFKLATLVTLLEDRKTTLSHTMKTNRGIWSYNGQTFTDEYLRNEDEVSVLWGFKKSSNQVFRKLVCDNYTGREKDFVDKLYSYKLAERFNFDIDGERTAMIPTPGSESWSGTSLPSIAIGYNVQLTPLHIVTFYNAIANNGKVMKPYLIESFRKNGEVVNKFGPTVLSGTICSQRTIDSVKVALRTVVTEGTGSKVKGAKCSVSGKTGTARIPITYKTASGRNVTAYKDPNGYRQHQATFVGFFPSEKPRYTAIVVIYSEKTRKNFYGGSWSAPVFREIVDNIYTSFNDWEEPIEKKDRLPEPEKHIADATSGGTVPDLTGMGLSEAVYVLENKGYKVNHSGSGKVSSQTPSAGASYGKGKTVTIQLR